MKKCGLIFLLAVTLVASSCTTFAISGVQVTLSRMDSEVLGDFETSVTVFEFLGTSGGANLFNTSADSMDADIMDAIRAEIIAMGGDAAINVDIVYKAGFTDLILNSFTGSLLAPARAIITGTVVKF